MKTILLIFTILCGQLTFGQTDLDNDKRDQIVTLVENDTLPGEYFNHLPIKGTFKQLSLFRHPNGTFDYVTVISGEYQNEKPIGVWTYAGINQAYFWVNIVKKVHYYADSSVIKSDKGRVKYNSDSTLVTASINGMYSKVNISCESNLCFFQSEEKAGNRFYFEQEYLDKIIKQLRDGVPEIEIYLKFEKKLPPTNQNN